MIRIFYIIFIFLNSCSLVETKDIPTIARSLILGPPDMVISNEVYENMPYSFAKVKIGRSGAGLMVLLSIEEDIHEWIGPNDEKIFTKNGKIIKTIGLDYNVKILNPNFSFQHCDSCNFDYYMQLFNPEALITQRANATFLSIEDLEFFKTTPTRLMIENFYTSKFKWNGENKYWFDKDGVAIKTVQEIHPNLGKVEITFFYK